MKQLIISLVLCCSLASCGTSDQSELTNQTEEVSTNRANPLDNPAITTGPLEEKVVSHEIKCSGRIEIPPTDLVSVHSVITGQVSDLRYLPGDYVKKGALLLRISSPDLIPKQRQLLETKASLEVAKKELERQQLLASGEATTASKLNNVEGQVNLLNATYEGLKSELLNLGIGVTKLEAEQQFQSSIAVYARQAGFMHEVNVNEGQLISPTNQLMEIAGTNHLHLELEIPSREIGWIKKDQVVAFQLPFGAVTGSARIEKINPMVDESSSTLRVHCHFPPKTDMKNLLPGLFVNATIAAGQQTLTGLPRDAVVKNGERYFAFRITPGEFEKIELSDPIVSDDFVAFKTETGGTWVTGGAYYLEGGE